MEANDVVLGAKYLWAMRRPPGKNSHLLRYLCWIEVEAVGKTDKRIKVRFDWQGKTYTRTVSTVNLIPLG